jgi:hypothetical protein
MPIIAERATREISARARMRTEEYFCNQYIAENESKKKEATMDVLSP